MANTIFTQNSTFLWLAVGTFHRYQASKLDQPIHVLQFNSKFKYNRFPVLKQNLGLRFPNDATRKMNMTVKADTTPGAPPPFDPFSWKAWILGAIFTALLSFSRGKWGPLLQLKAKVETTIEKAEGLIDIVEEVAERVEKVAEDAVKNLPEGKLRDAAEFIEDVAENIDERAEKAEDALEKVENMVESFIESTIHKENTVTINTEADTITTNSKAHTVTTNTEAKG